MSSIRRKIINDFRGSSSGQRTATALGGVGGAGGRMLSNTKTQKVAKLLKNMGASGAGPAMVPLGSGKAGKGGLRKVVKPSSVCVLTFTSSLFRMHILASHSTLNREKNSVYLCQCLCV